MINILLRILAGLIGLGFIIIGSFVGITNNEGLWGLAVDLISSLGFGTLFLYYSIKGKDLGDKVINYFLH